ncbi:hypothetical protein P167DRAFT_159497 [Morchella conica CCBAS932]|uniref:Uncharacterized protein n=1 Tax=Morchella conica CCBAS932 TaxID=1392247 RepID=A0A3N4L3D9_9PEZI|nr:hypothetical protein P167DRAFT_159497 [Morchella conica CCBAS932]
MEASFFQLVVLFTFYFILFFFVPYFLPPQLSRSLSVLYFFCFHTTVCTFPSFPHDRFSTVQTTLLLSSPPTTERHPNPSSNSPPSFPPLLSPIITTT